MSVPLAPPDAPVACVSGGPAAESGPAPLPDDPRIPERFGGGVGRVPSEHDEGRRPPTPSHQVPPLPHSVSVLQSACLSTKRVWV